MGVGLQEDEAGVSGENNGIGGVSIGAAAEVDCCVPVIIPLWELTIDPIAVVAVLIIPFNPSHCGEIV